jgi:hypothetical protein
VCDARCTVYLINTIALPERKTIFTCSNIHNQLSKSFLGNQLFIFRKELVQYSIRGKKGNTSLEQFTNAENVVKMFRTIEFFLVVTILLWSDQNFSLESNKS